MTLELYKGSPTADMVLEARSAALLNRIRQLMDIGAGRESLGAIVHNVGLARREASRSSPHGEDES